MDKPQFVYVIYILTMPEKLWNALIDGELTRQYWGHDNVSDWQSGSTWQHRRTDAAGTVDLVGRVVESLPPQRLVLTWARPAEADDEAKHSQVTFEIEPIGQEVRLTVSHRELDPQMLQGISAGWPAVLSNLKTLLETGRPMPGLFEGLE